MPRCIGSKPDGTSCERIVGTSQSYCYSHDPGRIEDRKRSASKGGKRGGKGRPQAELNQLKGELREVIEAVRTGELDKGIGAVVFQGYNVLLKAHAVALDVQERLELLPRLEEVEERMREKGGNRWGA